MDSSPGISVHSFPSSDASFRADTQRIVADAWQRIHDTDRLIAAVQVSLREIYPAAIVRLRGQQAEIGTPAIRTIYAFRDGRAT